MIKLGVIHCIEAYGRFFGPETEQKPNLFLADTPGRCPLALVAVRQAITQPALGAPDKLDIVHAQAHFLMQFTVKRLFRGFAEVNPPLRELPATITGATCPQHVAVFAGHDNAHVGPEPVGIDGFDNSFHGAHDSRFHYPAVYGISAGPFPGAGL